MLVEFEQYLKPHECDNLLENYTECPMSFDQGISFYFIENPTFSISETLNRKYYCSDNISALDNRLRLLIKENLQCDLVCRHGARYSTYHNSPLVPWHHDAGTPSRYITAIVFLSERSEYDDGSLLFKDYPAPTANKGDLVLFTSESLHSVMPVTTGTRKTLIFYYEH